MTNTPEVRVFLAQELLSFYWEGPDRLVVRNKKGDFTTFNRESWDALIASINALDQIVEIKDS